MPSRFDKRVPRIAGVATAVVVLGVAAALVMFAWRANRQTTGPSSTVTTESPDAGGLGPFAACSGCHGDLDKVFKEGKVVGLLYRHEMHFAKGVSDCAQCHPADTHDADVVHKPTMERCFVCHGRSEQAMAPGTCTTCHPPGFPDRPQTHFAADWKQAHGEVALADRFQCLPCHDEESFCSSCHGLEMPHPEEWRGAPHVQTFFTAGMETCTRCHLRDPEASEPDFCDSCHHPQDPSDVSWRSYHPEVVKTDGGGQCFRCHDPATCASCHVRGKEDFSSDEANFTTLTTPSGGGSSSTTAGDTS